MSKALYRKYRSKTLDEIIGQRHITDILARSIKTGNISHAYLLTGPRGVGKTSVARILAHEINGIPYDDDSINLDIIEIDAASNNGVEDVRDLREKVSIAPVAAKKKVYIIDEVHMLSKPAFNALLKTLEEPPEHIVFILATTNVEKLPATIVSRTQRFSFRPISQIDTISHLRHIADSEKIKVDDEALQLIALHSDGSFRDSISLLDQMSNLVDEKSKDVITAKLIEETLGLAPTNLIDRIMESIDSHDVASLVSTLEQAQSDGVSCSMLINQLCNRIRQLIPEKPQLLELLDQIIDIDKSPKPQIKLLSVLGQFATPKQPGRTMALNSSPNEITATIAELEKKASEDKPDDNISQLLIENNTSVSKNSGFNWNNLVEYARQNFIAIYSVLAKCNYRLDDDILTIYTGNKFYKKKLDDNKYRPLLSKCLESAGGFGLDIHTIATAPPPKDSHTAAIVAIMGGGEEVSIESA